MDALPSSVREEKEISSFPRGCGRSMDSWIVTVSREKEGRWNKKGGEKKKKKKKRDFSLDTASISSDTIFQGLLGLQCNSRKKSRAKGRRRREMERVGARDKETTKRLSLRDVSLASSRRNIFRNALQGKFFQASMTLEYIRGEDRF